MIKKLWEKWMRMYNAWYYNAWYFPVHFYKMIKEFCFFIKNGYTYEAVYSHCDWFIDMEKKILKDFSEHLHGYPGCFEKFDTEESPDGGEEEWKKVLLQLIECLNKMDEKLYKDVSTKYDSLNAAKEEFFDLFSKYFYDLWD